MAKFRKEQRQIIEGYEGGLMGIAAVPGSGKTFTLSHLAARLVEKITRQGITGQEVLIVTFSNSAVNNFKKKIADILQQERQMLPYVGYRVRTLHGLAHDIVRERPNLVGLPDDFQIVDERLAASILRDVVEAQMNSWAHLVDYYIRPDLSQNQEARIRFQEFPELMVQIASVFIKQAKDQQLTPAFIFEKLKGLPESFDLSRFATDVYFQYQRSLSYRGAVDFDDLVMLALQALKNDAEYLERLQRRWVYVLEDEAQDSSLLQEKMLHLLAGDRNWVRVGDPNQAINTTFTTADSSFLRKFLDDPLVQKRDLPTSGRSGQPIIEMANELVRWTIHEHPAVPLRSAFYEQYIAPTAKNDPQKNPPAEETRIHIHYAPGENISPERELELVIRSLKKGLSEDSNKTVAVLVPENSRGFKLAEQLREAGIAYHELLRSTTEVRRTALYLSKLLQYLAMPYDVSALAALYEDVWWELTLAKSSYPIDPVMGFLKNQRHVEKLVIPVGNVESPFEFPKGFDDAILENLESFFAFLRFALAALSLPIDQLILTVSQRLFKEPVDIALSYKVASLLRSFADDNPSLGISDFLGELRLIAENQRRFVGFDDVVAGFEPDKGVPTIATMHAAKGLEWDRVYLLAVSNYAFPSLQPFDTYVSEKWYIRDFLSLDSEVLGQLFAAVEGFEYFEGNSSLVGRESYCEERLRLLYVSITRAKSELVVTWNTGRYSKGRESNVLSLPVQYLNSFLV